MNPEPRPETWTSGLRRLGIAAATAASALLAAYVAVLVLGLSAIADQAVAIPDPWFTAM